MSCMVALKRSTLYLVSIGEVDEFFDRRITDEVTPTATVKPPSRLIDQYHEKPVTRRFLERAPHAVPAPTLIERRCQRRRLRTLLE